MICREREDRRKSHYRWGLLLALTMVGSGQALVGRGVRAGVKQANARITLRVYNYAVSPSLLSHAEAEATVILTSAKLDPVWVDCPVRHADVEKYTACNRTIGQVDFILKMLTRAQSGQFRKRDDELGQALDCPKAQGPCLAYIFYSDLRQAAEAGDVPEFCLLGHVLAHEIGHFLLGPKSHSAAGIMQAEWSNQALRTIARNFLFFNDQQARRMQDDLLARGSADQTDQKKGQPGSKAQTFRKARPFAARDIRTRAKRGESWRATRSSVSRSARMGRTPSASI